MTVDQLIRAMPVAEYYEWCQYLQQQKKPDASAMNLADATPQQMTAFFGT